MVAGAAAALLLLLGTGGPAAAHGGPAASTPGFLRYADFAGSPYSVSYDKRSLLVDGKRSFFASVGIHYPRFTPGQWDDVFLKAKNDGYAVAPSSPPAERAPSAPVQLTLLRRYNMIQTYFFHNAHQPKLLQFPWNLAGPANLTLFLEKAAAAGMFVDLRIGPCEYSRLRGLLLIAPEDAAGACRCVRGVELGRLPVRPG